MAAEYLLRHFAGFVLQLMPATLLLLLPFDNARFRLHPRKTWAVFALVVLGLSAAYAGMIHALTINMPEAGGDAFLFGNLFLCASILVIACLFFLLVRDAPLRKGFLFFTVIAFAAIQYSLVNVLLRFTPPVPAGQAGQSYDINTCIMYLLVTAVLFPPVAVFFRRSMGPFLRSMHTIHSRRELWLLLLMTALYLMLTALLSMLWARFQEATSVNQSFFAPVILLLTAMLFIVCYSVIKLSNLRAVDAERHMEAAVIRMDHDRIRRDMEKQRESLHDTRQLLRTLYMIAKSGDREELQAYYDETVEHIRITDESFCWDSCMNGILQYYASLARSSGIPFSARASCADLSGISETDLTVLMGNALENAIRAARMYRSVHPESGAGITLMAEEGQNMLLVQLENPCCQVVYTPDAGPSSGKEYLSADAFVSTSGGGNGLHRITSIAEKYAGIASFRYDENDQRFFTRITLVVPEQAN